ARVQVFDSLSASIGLGMQVRRAVDLANNGASAQDIVQTLTAERTFYHLLFFADTLEFLHRGGRIGKASQLVGSILKIKPLLLCKQGEVVPLERTRNRSRAIQGLIDYARRFASIDALSILHDGTDSDDVEHIKAELADIVPPESVIVSVYGPIIATHVGPGALGLCLRTKEAEA
ncbi:MAG: DegV family protein, partial [Chloroflexota bacterium]|nr:DegV family protein [Chloroflexota bacterium]